MSFKKFYWGTELKVIIAARNYIDGNPVEYHVDRTPELHVWGWHNVSSADRTAIANALAAKGWSEGEEVD